MYERLPGGMFWSRQGKLIARDFGASQLFAEKVSLYGDTTVISAKNDEKPGVQTGCAYVYRGINTVCGRYEFITASGGTWSQQQKLVAVEMEYYKNKQFPNVSYRSIIC